MSFFISKIICANTSLLKIVRKKCFLKKFPFSAWLAQDCEMFPDNFVVNCMKVLFLSDWPNPSLVNLDCKLEMFRLESAWYLISCRYCSLTTFKSEIDA